MELAIAQDTILKPSTAQSTDLPPEVLAYVKAGDKFPVLAYLEEEGHIKFTINSILYPLKELHSSGNNTWFAFKSHVEDPEGVSPTNNPREIVPTLPGDRMVSIVGVGARGLSQRIDGCEWFTWGEATRGGARLPDTPEQSTGIISVAKTLDQARKLLGDRPITITSWLRPVAINRAVGGAPNSTHIRGIGVDIAVQGMTPRQVYAALDPWHAARGGLAHGRGFVHIDIRGGGRARWSYPGA